MQFLESPTQLAAGTADWWMPGLGGQLIYREATGLEKSMADVEFNHLALQIDAEAIIDEWDPLKCPLQLLPYLAWAMGVTFWNDNWSETTKRNWVANQWDFKAKRGTAEGIAMVVDYAGRDTSPFGYKLLNVIRQPQGMFPGASVSPAARQQWLNSLPQLRVYFFQDFGTVPAKKLFVGSVWRAPIANMFLTTNYLYPSTAKLHLGRAATWYDAEGNADAVTVNDSGTFYQIYLNGIADEKVFPGYRFYPTPASASLSYPQPSDAWRRILTIEPNATSTTSPAAAVGPSLQAIQAQPTLITQNGNRGLAVYCGSKYYRGGGVFMGGPMPSVTDRYFLPSTAKYRIYDAYAVFDPAKIAPGPVSPALLFMGMAKMGWPDYTAQVEVFMAAKRKPYAFNLESFFAPNTMFFVPHDSNPMNYVCSAIEAARRMSDKILLQPQLPPTLNAGADFIAGDSFVVGNPQQVVPTLSYPY